ncbi:hypothetical protein GCM10012280_19270 [Wenjunlia tyrosinilytica]|uniref:NlpC/P60 domain-containing protein n=1 Tax=Wenjunlia tyrosinilytica TaxID=1544741 RepID=A0A917ZMW8_9ACTN|nr:hypothetical protein GCM10012280_19270 [Wenjunlia tyrosinilytica]
MCGAVLAAAALALPAQAAHAAPTPGPGSGSGSGGGQASDSTFDHTLPPGADSSADGSDAPLEALLGRLQSLYGEAEKATEGYNRVNEKLRDQRKALTEVTRRLERQREDMGENRKQIGRLARSQYRDGNLSDYSRLLLSPDPQTALERTHLIAKAADSAASLTKRLREQEKRLDRLVDHRSDAVKDVEKLAREQKSARDKVKERLDRVEKVVGSLTGAQLEELRQLEERGASASQAEFLHSGILGTGSRRPSEAGQRAIAYAFRHLGDPYVWGAEGPRAFDCSGLTSQAWAHAGRPVPRTSQEQWERLPRVPLNQLRPGDLVIYFPGATHVGMYIGNGMIVQAPRPGDRVKVSPVGSMPVLGAVRPDPEAESVKNWSPKR